MKKRKADTWMPFYVGDYLADTMLLTTLQHGAYLLLMLACWKSGGALPDDDDALASAAKLSPAEWRKHGTTLRAFFSQRDGRLVHKRIGQELERAGVITRSRAEAGAAGAAARWGSIDGDQKKTRSQRLAEARAKGRHTNEEWEALQWATGYRCVCCGMAADELYGGVLSKHHIVPIYQDGSDGIDNIQPTCKSCSGGKGNDRTDYRETSSPGWRERLAKRLANARQTPAPSQSQSQVNTNTSASPRPADSTVDAPAGTPAGQICKALKAMGLARVNPSSPRLQGLIDAGATLQEFAQHVPKALTANDPFAYLLGVVEGERKRAADTAGQLHRGAMPTPLRAPTAAEQRVLDASPGLAAAHLRPVPPPTPFTIDAEVTDVAPRALG